jgi:gliding motility-associated-like protein
MKANVTTFWSAMLICWFLMPATTLHAQVSGVNGHISLSFKKACSGATITIDPLSNESFWCFDGVNSSDIVTLRTENQDCFTENNNNNTLSFTYSSPGSYVILWFLEGSGTQDPLYDSLRIEIVEPTPPRISYYGCPGGGLVLDIDRQNYAFDNFLVNWGDGTEELVSANQLPLSHQYANANQNYSLAVTALFDESMGGSNAACGIQARTTVSLRPDQAPLQAAQITRIRPISAQAITMDVVLGVNTTYELYQRTGNGAFTLLRTVVNQSQIEVANLNLAGTTYAFELRIRNECDQTVLSSNTVSPIFLTEATAEETGNVLRWQSRSDVNQPFTIFANGQAVGTSASGQFLHAEVICGVNYTYSIRGSGPVEAISNEQETLAIKPATQLAISHVSTEVISDQELLITWENPAAFEPDMYYLYLSFDDRDFFLVDSTTQTSYIYPMPVMSERWYFRLAYRDNCNGLSALSPSAANMLVTANDLQRNMLISWNPFRGWASGVTSYTLEKFDRDLNLITRIRGLTSTNFLDNIIDSDEQGIIYRVTALGNDNRTSISNDLFVKLPPVIEFPTAFTPNGDNRNDFFRVFGKFIAEYELFIFNRWGNVVYYSQEPMRGWDGDFQSQQAPAGVYIYKVNVIDENGDKHTKEGNFILIRN